MGVCILLDDGFEEVIPMDCFCRLVKYDEFHDYLERSYEGEEDTPMGLLLGESSQHTCLICYWRQEDLIKFSSLINLEVSIFMVF